MDLQTIVNAINKTGFENRSKQMFTLGDLIQDLEKLPQNADITIEPFHLVPDFFTSYRGYYSDLCLTYKTRYESYFNYKTVSDLLQMAKECVNKEFTGYKGGEFTMTLKTPIWISDDDFSTGMGIKDIVEAFDNHVYINTTKIED